MSADFSIVIPVYNEIASLHKLFDLLAKIDSEANQGMEIVFVSDGSTDGSDGMIEEWETRFLRKRYIRHDINFGYGAALGTGINAASGKWVVTMDSDGQHDPHDAMNLLQQLSAQNEALMYIGSRRTDYASFRGMAKGVLRLSQRLLLGINFKDANSGMKAVRKDVYDYLSSQLPLPLDMAYSQSVPLVLSSIDKRFVGEIPVAIDERAGGESKVVPKDFFYALRHISVISLKLFPWRIGLVISFLFLVLSVVYSLLVYSVNYMGIPNGGMVLFFTGALLLLYTESRYQESVTSFTKLKRELIRIAYHKE